MRRSLVIAAVAAALALGLAFLVGCGKKSASGEGNVIATVNGKEVTRTELCDSLEDQDMASGGRALDSLISQQLVRQEAEKRGIKVTEADLKAQTDAVKNDVETTSDKTFAEYLKASGQTEKSLQEAVSFRILLSKLTLPEDDQKKFFAQYGDRLKPLIPSANEVVTYRRIIVATKPEAEAVRKEVAAKPADFAKVADEKSLDPMGRGRGGLAPAAAKGGMNPPDPEFEKVLFSLKPGEISQPLPVKPQMQPGSKETPPERWQVVKVEKHSTPKPFTYENYAPQIQQIMLERDQRYQSQLQQFLAQLEAKANIAIVSPRYQPLSEMYKQRRQSYEQMKAAQQGMPGAGMPGAGAAPGGPGAPGGAGAPGGPPPAPQGRAPRGR